MAGSESERRVKKVEYNSTMTKKRTAPAQYVQPYRYASPNIPTSAIRRFARQIAERFHPEKIILFGSYAYGTPHNESDVDLLVIMPAYDVVAQEIRIGLALDRPFSHDIVVRTPQQVARGLKQNNWFLREVIEKGKVLYDARNGSVGPVRQRRLASGKRSRRTNAASPKRVVFPLRSSRRKSTSRLCCRNSVSPCQERMTLKTSLTCSCPTTRRSHRSGVGSDLSRATPLVFAIPACGPRRGECKQRFAKPSAFAGNCALGLACRREPFNRRSGSCRCRGSW